MLNYNSDISKPKSAEDFEEFCLIVYRLAFGDRTATKNGRSGQKQNGVDIFVRREQQRVGIQCKRTTFDELDSDTIDKEVASADTGNVPISELIVATTAPNDAKLIRYAQELSDQRKARGSFTVSLAFWDTLESFVRQYPELQFHFAPNAPGGAFYRASQENRQLLDLNEKILAAVASGANLARQSELPEARKDSLNKVITGQLDDIRQAILASRYRDALDRLGSIGDSFDSFDTHQRFRWHSQRAVCYWRLGDKRLAAKEYERAYELAPDDDKASANAIRAKLLLDHSNDAVTLADEAVKRFPSSSPVWSAWANARCVAGHNVELASIPLELREVDEMLHTFAWISLRTGNRSAAVEFSLKAYQANKASFDTKSLFLTCALSLATTDPIRAALGFPKPEDAALLADAINAFIPLRENLWSCQDNESVAETILHLGYALAISGKNQEAQELLEEGAKAFPAAKYINRALLECLQRGGDGDAAYQFGLRQLEHLDEPGLAMLAELAAHRGDRQTVEAVRQRSESSQRFELFADDIEALYWLALWKSEKTDELRDALSKAHLNETTSISKLSVAVRILFQIPDRKQEALELVTRMNSLIQPDTASGHVLQAAEASVVCGEFDNAANLLERVLPEGVFSELHEKLLFALIKSGNRRKAFALIKKTPVVNLSENFRHLAIELAQAANDWGELRRLAELELKHNPDRADAWLFRAVVHLNEREFEALRVHLAKAPMDLKGSAQTLGGLANLDTRFGDPEKGAARMYRRFRQDLADAEAASVYFILSSMAPVHLFTEEIAEVAAGTTVFLRTEGQERQLTIDPQLAGVLPANPEFVNASEDVARKLVGKRAGDKVSITESFGFTREYEVVSLQSAYLSIGKRAAELIHGSIKPVKGLLSVPVPTGADGKPDFSHVLDQLKRQSSRIKVGFQTYGEGKLTVGLLAAALGTDTVTLSSDWPAKPAPYLYVCSGKSDERTVTQQMMGAHTGAFVIDLLTVTELVACEAESALAVIGQPFIAQSAVGTLSTMLDEARHERSAGRLYEQNGQMAFIEQTEPDRKRRIDFLDRLNQCVKMYCRPTPVYGPERIPDDIRKLYPLLDTESLDAILLSLEQQAVLLTLDGRLRELSTRFGQIPGVWPQVLMQHALASGAISATTYSYALLRQLAKRRSHISLGPRELWWILQQDDNLLQSGVRVVREHLSDPRVDAVSAFRVVSEVMEIMLHSHAQLGAIAEIAESLLAAVFSHPSLSKDRACEAAELIVERMLDSIFAAAEQSFFERDYALQKHGIWSRHLIGAVRRASEASHKSIDDLLNQSPRVRNLFCSQPPRLIYAGPKRP